MKRVVMARTSNLFNRVMGNHRFYFYTTGILQTTNDHYEGTEKIPVVSGQRYTLSVSDYDLSVQPWISITFYDESGNFTRYASNYVSASSVISVTISDTEKYVSLAFWTSNVIDIGTFGKIMFNEGNQKPYEPYMRRCLPVTYKAQQLVKNGNFEDTTGWTGASAVTFKTVDNEMVVTARKNASGDYSYVRQARVVVEARTGHTMFLAFTAEVKEGQIPSDFAFARQGFGDYTSVYAHGPALSKSRYTAYYIATNDSSYMYNGYLQVVNATAGMKWAFSDVVCVDVTDLYGAGNEPTSVSTFLSQHPEYNSFVPFYGGKITQRRIIETKAKSVDLGTFEWGYWEPTMKFYANIVGPEAVPNTLNLACNGYIPQRGGTSGTSLIDKGIGIHSNGISIYIRDDSFNGNATAFKQAMQGVILTYETT